MRDREKKRAYGRAYRAAHLEERRAFDRAYHAANREERNGKTRAYRAAHREDIRANYAAHREARLAYARTYGRDYYAAHREARLAYGRTASRAAVRNLAPTYVRRLIVRDRPALQEAHIPQAFIEAYAANIKLQRLCQSPETSLI